MLLWMTTLLPRGWMLYLLGVAAALGLVLSSLAWHHHRVTVALREAREAGASGERVLWQRAQVVERAKRDAEEAAANEIIRRLESESLSLQSKIDSQETELEKVIQDSIKARSGGGSPPLLDRSLVRELDRQGRTQ